MAKFSSRDLLEILRGFDVASTIDVPRQIEHIEVTHPSPINTCFAFTFGKATYYILQDETAEDDEKYVAAQIALLKPDITGEVVANPHDTLTTYALPFKSKEVYLYRTLRAGKRLDVYLAETNPDISRSTWQKLIKNGAVKVNGSVVTTPKHEVKPDDTIEAEASPKRVTQGELPVIYEDADVIVINKPVGILTHSKGALNDEFTVAEFVRNKTDVGHNTDRPGIIHRLDRDTSGVIITARTEQAATVLRKQFADRKAKKTYLAVLSHQPKIAEGIIDIPIGRNPKSPSTFRADPNGKSAITKFTVLDVNSQGQALVKFEPRTGRTHQLRVHAAYLGTPIVGDRVYGKTGERLLLHAYQLEITLPGGKREKFTADIPAEFHDLFPAVTI